MVRSSLELVRRSHQRWQCTGSSSNFNNTYNATNEGMDFSGKFGSASTIWYPASGYRYYYNGSLNDVGNSGFYWSASPYNNDAYCLGFIYYGDVHPLFYDFRANGLSVRCIQVID